MYEYKNKYTGQIIKIESKISGNGWEEVVKTSPEKPAPKTPAKRKAKKAE